MTIDPDRTFQLHILPSPGLLLSVLDARDLAAAYRGVSASWFRSHPHFQVLSATALDALDAMWNAALHPIGLAVERGTDTVDFVHADPNVTPLDEDQTETQTKE